jgi:hypothetical protein
MAKLPGRQRQGLRHRQGQLDPWIQAALIQHPHQIGELSIVEMEF